MELSTWTLSDKKGRGKPRPNPYKKMIKEFFKAAFLMISFLALYIIGALLF